MRELFRGARNFERRHDKLGMLFKSAMPLSIDDAFVASG
jgi:hypothetical protein